MSSKSEWNPGVTVHVNADIADPDNPLFVITWPTEDPEKREMLDFPLEQVQKAIGEYERERWEEKRREIARRRATEDALITDTDGSMPTSGPRILWQGWHGMQQYRIILPASDGRLLLEEEKKDGLGVSTWSIPGLDGYNMRELVLESALKELAK